MKQRYADLAKDRLLNIKARIKQKTVPKILTFKNRVDGVLSNRDISGEDFVLELYKSPFLERTNKYLFQLTVGDGLTVQGDDNEQLKIEVTEEQANQRPDVYFWLLISNGEEVAWLNGDWEFFNGKYDGPVTETTEIIIADEGDEILIVLSEGGGDTNGKQDKIQFQDEGVNLGSSGAVKTINFEGAGVDAVLVNDELTITIPGGGGDVRPVTVGEKIGLVFPVTGTATQPNITVSGTFAQNTTTTYWATNGGADVSTFTNYALFDSFETSLAEWRISTAFDVPNSAATSTTRGAYVFAKRQIGADEMIVFWLDISSGSDSGKLKIFIDGLQVGISSTAISTITSITYECYKNGDILTVTAVNGVGERVSASYQYPWSGATPFMNGSYKFGFGLLESSRGNISVFQFSVGSPSYLNPELFYVGDSITNGYFAGSYENGFPLLMRGYGKNVTISGSNGAAAGDVLYHSDEIAFISPTYAILLLGVNPDASLSDFIKFHKSVYNQLLNKGADVWVLNTPPNVNAVAYNSALNSVYGSIGRLIDINVLLRSGSDQTTYNPAYVSNSHPNQAGHLVIHNAIISALGL